MTPTNDSTREAEEERAVNQRPSKRSDRRAGFTLVEVMIATALTLLLMAIVVQVFAVVGTAASDTREVIQVTDRLRACKQTMQSDLSNLTAPMLPPLKPDQAHGYFEYVEGQAGPVVLGSILSKNIDELDTTGVPLPDTSVGDPDDVLMFTTRNEENPFYGRYRQIYSYVDPTTATMTFNVVDGTTQSHYAEIIWFVRGNTLYRRVLLIKPQVLKGDWQETGRLLSTTWTPAFTYDISFYDKFDVSAHQEGGQYDLRAGFTGTTPFLVGNSLKDLTLRQNRYGHQPWCYPYDTRFWSPIGLGFPGLGMPTLRECTFYTNMISTSNAAVARWPFPFFDSSLTTNLWGSQQTVTNPASPAVPYPTSPVIFPYPSGPQATNYQPKTTLNTNYPPAINLTMAAGQYYDSWANPFPWQQVNPTNGAIYAFSGGFQPNAATNTNANQSYDGSTRVSDDVILTNVISFDVKAWDPNAPIISDNPTTGVALNPLPGGSSVYMPGDVGYMQLMNNWANSAAGNVLTFQQTVQQHTVGIGAYVDLNYMQSVSSNFTPTSAMYGAITSLSNFAGPGLALKSSGLGAVYDTGSFTYENDGFDQNGDGIVDNFTNGLDDNGVGGVDDVSEIEGPTPYPVPLKGIQVKIRVFEPDSRQIREVTITEDFLWE